VGADVDAVLQDIRKTLTQKIVVLQKSDGDTLISEWNKSEQNNGIIQQLVEFDDELMECYLEGEKIDFALLNQLLIQTTSQSQLIPVLLGAAKNGLGIVELLEALTNYFKFPTTEKDKRYSNAMRVAYFYKLYHCVLLDLSVHIVITFKFK